MESGIVVTINLLGVLSGPVKHTTKQVGTVDVSPMGSPKPEWMTRKIKHTNRTPVPCGRSFPISGEIITGWVQGENPYWVKPNIWKKLSKSQKIETYLSRLDEGYGFSFQ